uniref:SxtA short isoform n=1 Tax=Alexandrium fundyense TaxID=2932 RepID=F5BWX9_ALEFU|nr:SxtA short isoform precursor [Alexandrium fundyense]
MLVHGWTAAPLLLELVANFSAPLEGRAQTAGELAAETGAEEGPLAILLRACSVLGYVRFDAQSRAYSLVPGPELDELRTVLHPASEVARGLQELYSEVAPPFQLPSEDAARCLALWEEQRPSWSQCRSRALGVLLDGAVLAPLLVSVTYSSRWDEEGQEHGRDNVMERFDFSKMLPAQRSALGDIFEQLGVGTMNAKGVIMMSSKGAMALQRCYSYYVPLSYAPLMAQISPILFDDAGWGFTDAGTDSFDDVEEHVDRILNVVGSGAQHRTLFKDMMRHISTVFKGEAFALQPSFVVDTGCGDGSLLIHIYEHIKQHTPRGKVLDQFPLTMVGVDLNEDPRVTTAVNLSKQGVPHVVISGDVGKPAEILAALKKKKVDASRTLHVRSFLDHDRTYIPPVMRIEEESSTARFARTQMADFVHLDKRGKPITALELFASLVEHFERWADALEVSFGLCVLEVMMLDVPTTQRWFNDCVSFPLDFVQCLSRQYMVSAAAFTMGAAMAGLLPADFRAVETYPEHGRYNRMLSQHLVKRPFRLRLAEVADLQSLVHVEELAWPKQMQGSLEVLRRRLEASPTTNLVCELEGRVVAVLYMQRIESLAVLDGVQFMDVSSAHSPRGRLLQLISIAVHPDFAGMNLGRELKEFGLHLARLDSTIERVIGVTRCSKEFRQYDGPMSEYVNAHFSGARTDSTLDFHSSAGAQFVRLVEGFRPEDTDNGGTGVVIAYDIRRALPREAAAGAPPSRPPPRTKVPSLQLVQDVMTSIGYPPNLNDLTKGFFDYGMDSLELVRIRNKLSLALQTELPATLLLDFPTVHDLVERLDQDRAPESDEEEEVREEAKATARAPAKAKALAKGGEATQRFGPSEIISVQKRCLNVYAQPIYQKRFTDMAKKCFPDMLKYILAIESILVEVEGPVLQEFQLIQDLEYKSVQRGRENLMYYMSSYWLAHPEIRDQSQQLLLLTLQDQCWGNNHL